MGLEDLSRRDIKPGLIIYPQPDAFFKDTEYYKFMSVPPNTFPYVCLWVNEDEGEWARITRKDAPDNIRVDKTGILNPSNGFLEGDSFVSHSERFVIPISNVMAACQSSKTPRPAFSPQVTKKIREKFGYEPKTEGTPLAMAVREVVPTLPVKKINNSLSKKTRKKSVRELKPVYEKMLELHQVDGLNCKQIAAKLNSPTATESSVRRHLRSKGVYNKNIDVVKSNKNKNIVVLSAEDEEILKAEALVAELKKAKLLKIKEQAEDDLKYLVDKYNKDGVTITYTVV